jgi:ATP/maltotriose-dependent transcriptional regulator MalT
MYWLACSYAGGDLEKATAILREALKAFEQISSYTGMAQVKGELAWVARQEGDFVEARRLYHEALIGYETMAIVWGMQMTHSQLGRTVILIGDYAEARQHLFQALALAVEYNFLKSKLSTLAYVGLLWACEGKTEQAVELMSLSISLMIQRKLNFPVLGNQLTRRLNELKDKLPADDFSAAVARGKLRDLDTTVKEILAELREAIESDQHSDPIPQSLPDPLTERELEILRLLADGLNNQAAAEKLFLGVETIRWYLKHIYSKLDVHSRTQAIARARELNLFT